MEQTHTLVIGILYGALGIFFIIFIYFLFSRDQGINDHHRLKDQGLQCRYTNLRTMRTSPREEDIVVEEEDTEQWTSPEKWVDEGFVGNDNYMPLNSTSVTITEKQKKQNQGDKVQEDKGQGQCECVCKCDYGANEGIVVNRPNEFGQGAYLYPTQPHLQPISQWSVGTMPPNRDIRVLNDPLYPPLNRMVSTPYYDTFRLVGYLKSSCDNERDAGGNTWKLFGRMKDRRMGEFYISPANTNDDIKIPLTSDVMMGPRLSDIDTIPNELMFKSPLLNLCHYIFIELPRGQLDSMYI